MGTILAFFSRFWFPLALLALLLVALPGLVLFILHLSGADEDINAWLEGNYQLTYQFSLPPWLGGLLLAVPVAILLLYFLKLKRKPLQVPSTFLWKKSIEDLHVNSLFQWLRQNVLLLLQILTVLALLYAVLGFRFHGSSGPGRHYILVIDNSASMSASDVSPSRLDWAKQAALQVIDAAGDKDVGMLIVFNAKATTLQAYTSNKARLREAVQSIAATQRTTRLEEALNLADSLANPVHSTEDVASQPDNVPPGQERTYVTPRGIDTTVHLFSDGRFPDLSEADLANLNSRRAGNVSALGHLSLEYHRAGRTGPDQVDNVGLVAFNAVRWGGQALPAPDQDVHKLQVLVRLQNFRLQKTRVKLRLDVFVNGQLVHPEQKNLELPPRVLTTTDDDPEQVRDQPGEIAATFILPPLNLRANTVLRAYLDNHRDDFSLDDQAWLVVGSIRKAKVLIVGPGNPILDAFFNQEATRKVAAIERLAPADLSADTYRRIARSGEVDLVLFDRCAPVSEADLPLANTFFFDRPPPPWVRSGLKLKNPFLLVSKKDHPLLRHLTTLWDVGVAEGFKFDLQNDLGAEVKALVDLPAADPNRRRLPPLTRLIEASGQLPVLFTLPRGSFTDLVLTFPLLNDKGDLLTNWPLQTSFPLFLRNVLYTLGNVNDAVRETTVQPGESMVLRPEAGVKELIVTPPGGPEQTLTRGPRAEFIFGDTEQLGIYKLVLDRSHQRSFAVNLLDAQESNIEPRSEIKIGSEKVVAGAQRQQPRHLWKWMLLLALVLLMVEWYVYNRRIYI